MRHVYNLLIYFIAPLVVLHHWWRGLRDPAYRNGLSQRLGFGRRLPGRSIWIHAVSVGEVQASAPLVRALRRRYPATTLLVTTVTPTGAARARHLFGEDAEVRYVPLDLPGAVGRFFDRAQPRIAIILETEVWPNLFRECGRRSVPLVLASARVSPRSVGRYRRLVPLFRETLSHGIVIAAQSEDDAARFVSIGASPERTFVSGNIKFDFELQPEVPGLGRAWREANAPGRSVWVAGSTHEGEEEVLLEAHQRVLQSDPDALLILVPRHPNRFETVAGLLDRSGLNWVRRSSGDKASPRTQVVLGDTMGELMTFYAAADVAFVAGSLVTVGGHNLLEPASLALPMVAGPHNFNSEDVYRKMLGARAVIEVDDAEQLAAALVALFADEARRHVMGEHGRGVVSANRGALARLLGLVEPLLAGPDGRRDAGAAALVAPAAD